MDPREALRPGRHHGWPAGPQFAFAYCRAEM